MTATLGAIVNYTTATGNVVAAQVVCTERSHSPGRYVNRMGAQQRREALAGTDRSGSFRGHEDAYEANRLDVDGDEWIPSPVPAPKPGRVHLKVTAPNGNTYVEFNVPEDDETPDVDQPGSPGTWHWPDVLGDLAEDDEDEYVGTSDE